MVCAQRGMSIVAATRPSITVATVAAGASRARAHGENARDGAGVPRQLSKGVDGWSPRDEKTSRDGLGSIIFSASREPAHSWTYSRSRVARILSLPGERASERGRMGGRGTGPP